jgi:hypothetical protein
MFLCRGDAILGIPTLVRVGGEMENVISLAKPTAEEMTDVEDRTLEARQLGAKGVEYIAAKQIQEGYRCFEQVYAIAQEIGDSGLEATLWAAWEWFILIPATRQLPWKN